MLSEISLLILLPILALVSIIGTVRVFKDLFLSKEAKPEVYKIMAYAPQALMADGTFKYGFMELGWTYEQATQYIKDGNHKIQVWILIPKKKDAKGKIRGVPKMENPPPPPKEKVKT